MVDLVLLEGLGNFWEGSLFGFFFFELVVKINVVVLLVGCYYFFLVVDGFFKVW